MKRYTLPLIVSLILCASCSKEITSRDKESDIACFTASFAENQKTEVSSSDASAVLWSAKDQISIFSNGQGAKYVSTNTSPVKTAQFVKDASSAALPVPDEYYYGIYPYSEENAESYGTLTLSVPSSQIPTVGSFAKGSFVSVARFKGSQMAYYNVCGGIRFSLTQSGITKIEIRGNNGEELAGLSEVEFDEDGIPVVSDVVQSDTKITMAFSGISSFATGKWYYVSMLPVKFTKGYTITLYKGSVQASVVSSASKQVKRNTFASLADLDKGVVFEDNQLKQKWAELPSSPKNEYDYYYTVHITDQNDAKGNKARNYGVCYSKKRWCAMWIAAPYHKFYKGSSGRTDSYKTDPNFDFTQPGKWTGYTRGHLLGSAERTKSKLTNNQVFYYSNIAPQLQTYFNTGGGVWNDCEDWISGMWESYSDTTYVVTGCWWDPSQTTKEVSGTKIPTHYYKIILRTKNHSTKYVGNCTASELQCLAILIPHKTYSKAHAVKPSQYESEGWLHPVTDLESMTGFTFFPNVPNAPKNTYTLSDWGL